MSEDKNKKRPNTPGKLPGEGNVNYANPTGQSSENLVDASTDVGTDGLDSGTTGDGANGGGE